jgi:hypothetical protein
MAMGQCVLHVRDMGSCVLEYVRQTNDLSCSLLVGNRLRNEIQAAPLSRPDEFDPSIPCSGSTCEGSVLHSCHSLRATVSPGTAAEELRERSGALYFNVVN